MFDYNPEHNWQGRNSEQTPRVPASHNLSKFIEITCLSSAHNNVVKTTYINTDETTTTSHPLNTIQNTAALQRSYWSTK
jgi:hypothetical protein